MPLVIDNPELEAALSRAAIQGGHDTAEYTATLIHALLSQNLFQKALTVPNASDEGKTAPLADASRTSVNIVLSKDSQGRDLASIRSEIQKLLEQMGVEATITEVRILPGESEWGSINSARAALIRKERDEGSLSPEEESELERLQQLADAYADQAAPLSFDRLADLEARVEQIGGHVNTQ